MKLRSLQLAEKPSNWEQAMSALEDRGIRTTEDWSALTQDEVERIPCLTRKLVRLINEGVEKMALRNLSPDNSMFLWDGKWFKDDRLFILDLQPATKGGAAVWAVVTRWNHAGFPPFKVNDFPTQIEAIKFIKDIEPQTPRISLGGKSPQPPLSYVEYLRLLKRNGEPSAYAIYEANKHQERKLIIQEGPG